MQVTSSQPGTLPKYWPSARHFTEAVQCPSICFSHPLLRGTLPAVDRLGMPLVTSGQFAYVYKLKSVNGGGDFAVRCFRGYLGDRDQRYRAIQDHLASAPVTYLSDFTYAQEGILVGGNRYPILFMQWIDGPTLDLYIAEMLNRPDVLLHLSQEWLRLLTTLNHAGIAHGDLQHGNIIVDHGQLRLVDHDGIFVTKMAHWSASEIGHQHYQHPQRTADHFDEKLDNFSALVIYLSLLSLAENPQLWQEHHDENLLFTKSDFIDPEASPLFGKVRDLGPEHARLADVLANAAVGPPENTPNLLELVERRSTLPSWMTAPADLDTKTKTREVAVALQPPQERTIRWIPWQPKKGRAPSVPATPASSTVQTLFSTGSAPAAVVVHDLQDVFQNTIDFSREFARRYYLIWTWGAFILLKFIGIGSLLALFIALVCVVIGCVTFGLVRAVDEQRNARQPAFFPSWQPTAIGAPRDAQLPAPNSWNPSVSTPPTLPPAGNQVEPFVGNLVLGIYHQENCDWVNRISIKNRVGFSSPSEALSHGFKPCQICSP